MRAAERRVDDELHAAALVEEALEHDAALRRHGAERRARPRRRTRRSAPRRRAGRAAPHSARATRPSPSRSALVAQVARSRPTSSRVRAGRLAEPERDASAAAPFASATRTMPGLDAQDPPRRVAELEDVAAVRLDREVLVDGADERALGLEHAPGSRRCPGSRRRTVSAVRRARFVAHDAAVHAVAVEQRAAARRCAARRPRRSPRARGRGTARRGGTASKSVVLVPGLGDARGDDLLRQDVERAPAAAACGRASPLADAAQERRGLDELVERQREEPALRDAARARGPRGRRAAGTSRSSASRRPGSTRSTSPMSMPSSSDAVATSARSFPALSRSSASSRRSRERLPWWLVDRVLAEAARELRRRCARPSCACSRRRASCGARATSSAMRA